MRFLSEDNVAMHKEYLRELIIKLSIFEKSYTAAQGKCPREILSLGIPKKEREALFRLKCEISAHKIFFTSFNDEIKFADGSLRYELLCDCMRADGGFLLIYKDKKGRILHSVGENYREVFLNTEPMLALDICEHSYFYDYGFDKKGYLKAALSYLNVDKCLNIGKRD